MTFFYKIVSKTCKIYTNMFYKVKVIGLENIPDNEACILACNHKSNLDPIFIAGLIDKRPIRCIAKKELWDNKFLGLILSKLGIIGINRDKPELSTIKTILKALKNEEIIGIFPEGTRHKDLNSFAEAKAGLGMFAVKGKTSIIPISLVTNYKLFSNLTIYIDKPIYCNESGEKLNTDDFAKISNDVMEKIKDNYFDIKNSLK